MEQQGAAAATFAFATTSAAAAAGVAAGADAEDTTALLAFAEVHRLEPGGNIKEQLQQQLQQQQLQQQQQGTEIAGGLCRLSVSPSLFTSLALDNAGLGEGIYVFTKYAAMVSRRYSAATPD